MHAKKLIENALKEPAISEGSHAEIHVTGIFGPKDLYVEVYFITYHTNTMNAIKSFLNENPDLYDQWYYQSELKIL